MGRSKLSGVSADRARKLVLDALDAGILSVATVAGYERVSVVGDKTDKSDLLPGDWLMVCLRPTKKRAPAIRQFTVTYPDADADTTTQQGGGDDQ